MIFRKHQCKNVGIEGKLDPVLIKLLTDVRKQYMVKFAEHKEDYASNYTINKDATIYYNPQRFSNDSMAHELLHVWLKTLDYFGSNHIYLVAREDPKLSKVFSKELCDHIGNCQDHIKMYPKYLEMGYAPEQFIQDAMTEKASLDSLKKLELSAGNVHLGNNVDAYIGNLISIYAHHISYDYSKHLKLLVDLEPELFSIITSFWREWETFDITKVDFLNNGFGEYERLLSAMEKWAENKIII